MSRSANRTAIGALALLLLVLGAAPAGAEVFVRIVSQTAPVRSGPGGSYREIHVAERGEIYEVLERGTRDFWYRISLEDGTTGWILGDLVFPFEVVEEGQPGALTRFGRALRGALLGPSPVPYADVEISFSAGVLDLEGMFLLRPSWLLDSYLAIEGFAGISPRGDKDLFLGGLGFCVRLAPGAVIGPYAALGLGTAYVRPKADNFVDKEEALMALAAGGGVEITLKKQITVRLDARNWTLFDQDKAANGQEYSGGLAIFF
ncbi:MAG: SH3 domain-containing protein [Kofleriaceae bacterium]